MLQDKYINSQIELIYNGIDVEQYYLPYQTKFTNPVTRIVIVGRITPFKGQMDAIRAIEMLKDRNEKEYKLWIVGLRSTEMNSEEKKIIDYVKKNKLENIIEFIPFTNDVKKILSNCDIGLMCSKKEAFGRVTVEYMMSGLLAIGSDTGGTKEIIKNGVTGLLYKEGDCKSLADTIYYAVNHSYDSNCLIKEGQVEAIKQYSMKKCVEKVMNLYKNILCE